MNEKTLETALVPARTDLQVALRGAVSLWASATTSESERRADLLRDKQRIVLSFFRHTGKIPSEVEPSDVQGWLRGSVAATALSYNPSSSSAITLRESHS